MTLKNELERLIEQTKRELAALEAKLENVTEQEERQYTAKKRKSKITDPFEVSVEVVGQYGGRIRTKFSLLETDDGVQLSSHSRYVQRGIDKSGRTKDQYREQIWPTFVDRFFERVRAYYGDVFTPEEEAEAKKALIAMGPNTGEDVLVGTQAGMNRVMWESEGDYDIEVLQFNDPEATVIDKDGSRHTKKEWFLRRLGVATDNLPIF